MTSNWKTALTSAVLSLSVLGAGAALTSTAQAQMSQPMRGQWRSNYNIHNVRIRLENVIDTLQRDRHDYGGQRVQAIQLLQQARQHLLEAEQYQRSHPTNY